MWIKNTLINSDRFIKETIIDSDSKLKKNKKSIMRYLSTNKLEEITEIDHHYFTTTMLIIYLKKGSLVGMLKRLDEGLGKWGIYSFQVLPRG